MRLACISTILGYPWGSPDRLWTELAQRCLARGDAVFLGLSRLTADSAPVRDLQAAGAELVLRPRNSVYLGWRHDLARKLPWRSAEFLETRLARFAPDVVVITQGATYDSLAEHYLVQWLRASGTPYVVLCHNNADGAGPTAAETVQVRDFLARAAGVLMSSSHNRAVSERHLGQALARVGLLQNPLSPGQPEPWPAAGSRPILGLIGRLDMGHKGLDLLAAAFARLPSPRPRLVLTGRLENADSLAHTLSDCGVASEIELRGPLPPEQVGRAYGELELFLLTSRYEGCASSMLEAMRAGRPVLATPVGGVSDWIIDGVNGYVAPAISVEAIHATLTRALAERERWPALGAAARRTFTERRDPDPVGSLLQLVEQATRPSQ